MRKLIIALIAVSGLHLWVSGKPHELENSNELNSNFSELNDIQLAAAYPLYGTHLGSKEFILLAAMEVNWFAAQQLCSAYGYTLASINSQAEAVQLQRYLFENGFNGEYIWTSGNNLSGQKRFFWMSNGNFITYSNWAPGEPNNVGGTENCLEMLPNGKWNDNKCSTERYFVCENRCPLSSYDVPIYLPET